MTGVQARRAFDWEAAGRELGATLDAYHSLVVIGIDPVTTGRVAVGIGRAQAMRRRTAVGDLFAESPPIQALVTTDDPHGLVDSFLYGVSLSRIAREVPDAGQLFVMPSGTEPPDYDEIFPNPRWHRLTAGFREVGALLVLAAPASAPHLEDLVGSTDGAILVGEAVPRKLAVASVIASVREPTATPMEAAPPVPPAPRRWSRNRIAATAGIILTLALAGVAAWLAYRPLARGGRRALGPHPDTTKGIARVIAAHPESSGTSSAVDSGAAASTITPPKVINPGDSAQAAAYAVELMVTSTQAGAILELQKDSKNLPAATFAPVLVQGVRWYKVLGGAYVNRADADSLLATLRRRKVLDAGNGSVVRVPYAFLIDSGVRETAVPGMVATYADRGEPVYALRQPDGTAWLLAGAFETIDQSAVFAETLRASNTTPTLVHRKGRTF